MFGGLVDVSAGGARLRVKPGTGLVPGQLLAVDLELAMPTTTENLPPLRLYGRGTVLRVERSLERGFEACIRFEAPLLIAEGFRPPQAESKPAVSAELLN